MTMRRLSIAVLFLLATASAAAQEERCPLTQTIAECTNSIVKSTLQPFAEVAEARKAADTEEENADIAAEATGAPTVDSFLGNATRDFLSIFAAGLQTANLSEEQDALTLDWNLRVNELGDKPVKLQGVLRKPVLWKDFTDHLATGVDRTKLEDKLEDFDDLTLTVSYGPEDQKYGRNLAPHLTLFDVLHSGIAADITVQESTAAVAAREFALGRFSQNPDIQDIQDLQNKRFNELPPTRQDEARRLTIAAADSIAMTRTVFDTKFVAYGLDRFSDLLNNQPQLYFSASRRERSSLVGPRETTIKATYEKGFVNINTFRKEAADSCPKSNDTEAPPSEVEQAACAAAFKQYVKRPEIVAGLDAANRFAFSLEYSDAEDYTITDALVPTPFDVKGSRVTNGSIVYGRMMHRDRANGRDGRVDLSVTYADVRGDADKDNRFIASAIYTQKINDTMSFPIGVVWSNRDAHVPDSDQRLSAHFGLVFKMPKGMP